ncbi:MAG TPA: ferrochelatase [Acidimicrobiales bacterium]|nr:ferrochelatase [Acidimicrobiales bacterium]
MTTGLVVMAYGTPSSPREVEAYYTHIRRGRPPSAEQLAELTDRYQAIGGVSPLAKRTRAQVDAIAAALETAEPGRWRVGLGNKHAAPFVEDAVAGLAGDAATGGPLDRLVGLVLAPHYSRGSVGEYHQRAAAVAAEHGVPYRPVESWHTLPAWLDAQAARVRSALATLPDKTKVLFTAHSLPERVLEGDPYPDELRASATAIAERAGLDRWYGWTLAWQSAGRTPEPWRGPDVTEVIRDLGATGRSEGVLVCPQGFVSDHLEVLYDLDVDARRVAEHSGLAFARTASINDEPAVMAGLADLVRGA